MKNIEYDIYIDFLTINLGFKNEIFLYKNAIFFPMIFEIVHKKCFRNIYASHSVQFRFILSV